MSQTPNLDAARASLQQAIDQANAVVKPIIDAMREAGMLTPAPEPVSDGFRQSDTAPAAAPAVDDELLRDLRVQITLRKTDLSLDHIREWLSSQPMQRLRAAWTAEAVRSGDVVERAQYDHVLTEAKVVERERDEARAEVEHLRTVNAELSLDREVERLRATQQPEILRSGGPASRDGVNAAFQAIDQAIANLPCRCTEDDSCEAHHYLGCAEDEYRAELADAEADNTSSDDEPLTLLDELSLFHDEELAMGDERRRARFAAIIDAHRARGGQEADPAVEFLKRCAHCQAAWNQKTPHEECYQVEDGGTACCCKEAGRAEA